ncbi:MAG: preprotein translocase subunit SecE [Deltaproteobacteria bacterium RIFCSPLOWO2_12_FULL_40_28]|nr:MAG: preprotein translocase subunit SecE [Deltaproteobacteria bacterium RIFCSPHIGHO2_02_FULL_40_28]OGQ19377.1 MAG: preprotein translocase subunit SecE [Deltaproteobacteria bacterium RIFCSPHIGHO2_12_FULL_40_32]OGQ39590.1 MAG: preprotein translocase subunit SecE [Deltaproteobacteria bacterium RIFCSPLOWO2_02_FULL_40_36]OGQ53827.1 MAG: preprotein translocase subunit SecE [Deltaproteobacteria bacterium RIFCSPLOWO2_12_FULL_40_28]
MKISAFVNDVVVELGKVTWPQRKETVLSAVVVIVMVGIASVFLFTFDTLWGSLVQVLLSRV